MATTRKNVKKTAKPKQTAIVKSGLVEQSENKRAVRPVIFKARGKYKIVDGIAQTSIEPSSAETRTED